MPIIKNQIAKTTGFQRNCALNCLAHTVIENVGKIPEASLEALRKAFNSYYQTKLSLAELKEAIQIENPIHREIILGPVLRKMLGDTEILGKEAEENRQKGLDKPGKDLEDFHIVPLSNFFGIFAESFSSEIYRAQAFSVLNTSSPNFSGLDPVKKEKLVVAKMRELRAAAPETQYNINRFEGDNYVDSPVGTKKQIEAIYRAHGKSIESDHPVQYPTLKLWNDEVHFEREVKGSKEAQEHNRVYQQDDRFQYGLNRATGNRNSDGEPDAGLVREKIRRSIQKRKIGERINLSHVLTKYEKESVKQQSFKGQEGNLFSSLFGGVSDMLGGSFSSIGEKMFQAFAKPFTNASGGLGSGSKPTSGGWMGIIEGMMQFGLKMFEMIQGVASVAPEIGKAFESTQQGGQGKTKSKKAKRGAATSTSSSSGPSASSSIPTPGGLNQEDEDLFDDTSGLRSRFDNIRGAYGSNSYSSGPSSSSNPSNPYTPHKQAKDHHARTQQGWGMSNSNEDVVIEETVDGRSKVTYKKKNLTIEQLD